MAERDQQTIQYGEFSPDWNQGYYVQGFSSGPKTEFGRKLDNWATHASETLHDPKKVGPLTLVAPLFDYVTGRGNETDYLAAILPTGVGKAVLGKAAGKVGKSIKFPFGKPDSLRRTEAIDAYLSNSMNPEVKASFEKALQSDPALKKEVELQKEIIIAIQGKGLRELLQKLGEAPIKRSGGKINYSKFYK